ncbi:hypothetical protein M9H77_04940 [Catharanthus roseus]|uniref:Uncharacterized protein n=1 Tax=Catharanthus roseus TaxID=4058 RepID=A0ACC0CFU5_CATRO|nr:hypothetical protein M9H77_04940 [Catharanthus roseus]
MTSLWVPDSVRGARILRDMIFEFGYKSRTDLTRDEQWCSKPLKSYAWSFGIRYHKKLPEPYYHVLDCRLPRCSQELVSPTEKQLPWCSPEPDKDPFGLNCFCLV